MKTRVINSRKPNLPTIFYLILIGTAIGAITISSNKDSGKNIVLPKSQNIDYLPKEFNHNEYDIQNIISTGDINSSLINAFDEVTDTSFGSINEEKVLTNEKIENSYLVYGELNYNTKLTNQQKLQIKNWVQKVHEVNPNFDFRVLAKNIKKLSIEHTQNTNMYDEEQDIIMITNENYEYILNHLLYYAATNYADYQHKTNFSYSLDEVGYQQGIENVNFGRGICEMYAIMYSTQINGVLPNNGNCELFLDIEQSLESIYGRQAVLDCSSGCNVKTFANMLAKNIPNEDVIKLIASMDTLYIDNGRHTSLDEESEKNLIINIANYEINALYEIISSELETIPEEKRSEYITYRIDNLLYKLNKVYSNNPTFTETDYQNLESQLENIKRNLNIETKKVQL